MQTRIMIPVDLDFSTLCLSRRGNGDVSFDWAPIKLVCEASSIPLEVFTHGPEDNIAALITNWYMQHKAVGGELNEVAEDLIAETRTEDTFGYGFSHAPGTA